jgi:hypothetical protein
MVYAARNRSGRWLSPRVADATAAMLADAPLIRFSLHPPDARYPELMRHTQRVLERLLARRSAVTKAECAQRRAAEGILTSDGPNTLHRPSSRGHSQGRIRNAADRPSY